MNEFYSTVLEFPAYQKKSAAQKAAFESKLAALQEGARPRRRSWQTYQLQALLLLRIAAILSVVTGIVMLGGALRWGGAPACGRG